MHSEFTREDYEHAARAAGLSVYKHDEREGGVFIAVNRGGIFNWNPPKDDGDAFRLAVAAGIEIGNFHHEGRALAMIGSSRGRGEFWQDGPDPLTATRHAIFRAAIEIGKSMAQKGHHEHR